MLARIPVKPLMRQRSSDVYWRDEKMGGDRLGTYRTAEWTVRGFLENTLVIGAYSFPDLLQGITSKHWSRLYTCLASSTNDDEQRTNIDVIAISDIRSITINRLSANKYSTEFNDLSWHTQKHASCRPILLMLYGRHTHCSDLAHT